MRRIMNNTLTCLITVGLAGIWAIPIDCSRKSGTNKLLAEVQTPVEKTILLEEVKKMKPLNDFEKSVIRDKGTERPFSGKYWNHYEKGTYLCRECGTPLYKSDAKFESDCGWPAFDEEIAGAVNRQKDADGLRTETVCAKCGGHLGHVFEGEKLTNKNVRHCVNSVSMVFVPASKYEQAYFAGGCFWGVEHYFQQIPGVIKVNSGYSGGHLHSPSYRMVCTGTTGHAETVQVIYDPAQVSYETLAKTFFEIHDPTQLNRQGPDVGTQYRSVIFYTDDNQKRSANALIKQLGDKGLKVVTELEKFDRFWAAEDYHQDFVSKNPGKYICHEPTKRF